MPFGYRIDQEIISNLLRGLKNFNYHDSDTTSAFIQLKVIDTEE